MKKFGKFIFGTLSIATAAAGAYYLYKNVINKDNSDDFDDFDDFDDDYEDIDNDDAPEKDMREYVSINITTKNNNSDIRISEQLPEEAEEVTEEAADVSSDTEGSE
ncbi:MAG: hypothetical protein GX288_09985 [Clostridiales bacterium]|nr:hypothetical protein [Clostridiales bacterium]